MELKVIVAMYFGIHIFWLAVYWEIISTMITKYILAANGREIPSEKTELLTWKKHYTPTILTLLSRRKAFVDLGNADATKDHEILWKYLKIIYPVLLIGFFIRPVLVLFIAIAREFAMVGIIVTVIDAIVFLGGSIVWLICFNSTLKKVIKKHSEKKDDLNTQTN